MTGALAPALGVVLAAVIGSPLASLSAPAPDARVERRLALMGTELTLIVEADSRPAALAASEGALGALEAAEARLSTWRPDSELALLNHAPAGEPFRLSPELAADLAAAESCSRATGGAFDPTVGALAAVWGLRQGGRQPSEEERREALEATGLEHLTLAPEGSATRRHPGLTLEEGGFGKGAGLAAALAVLEARGEVARAYLDLGGQVAVMGAGVWEVPLADPRDRARPVAAVTLGAGSLATSGNSERGLSVDGERRSHILDPLTGAPAADLGSLTVWTSDPLLADCLSTGLYVMGAEAALAWAAARPGVEVLVLTPEGGRLRARGTPGLAGRVASLTGDLDLLEASPLYPESGRGEAP